MSYFVQKSVGDSCKGERKRTNIGRILQMISAIVGISMAELQWEIWNIQGHWLYT